MKFSSIKDDLEKKLNDAGFPIKIETKINKEKSLETLKEIEQEKTKEVPKPPKKEDPYIMGGEIKDEITSINNITFEMDNVTVEAKVFGIETFESSKTNFKIITLKITIIQIVYIVKYLAEKTLNIKNT